MTGKALTSSLLLICLLAGRARFLRCSGFGAAYPCCGCCDRWIENGEGDMLGAAITSIVFICHSAGIAGFPGRAEFDEA